MSANDRAFDDAIVKAKALLEGHDDAEYEALAPSAKANYQEALEFLSRLESSLEIDEGVDSPSASDAGSDGKRGTDIEIDSDLEATMGDDGDRVGPFGGDDVVVYDPNDDDNEGWLSMRYDATVSLEELR